MLLEEIKKDCKILTNEEHQGEELYFDNKPIPDIITTLKENGYRWHRQKNCWYRKLDYKGTEEKKQQNYLGVKVGDIFVFSWGYEQSNVDYFQVVGLKGTKQVIIREIAYKITETTGFESYKVKPVKDGFLERSTFIEDNTTGAVKQVKQLGNGTIFINMASYGWCCLWDGADDVMTSYY